MPEIPLISVVITAFGETEAQFRRALESLQANSGVLSEILVVDDGVTLFDTLKYEGFLVGPHAVRVIKQSNSGLSVARNTGLLAAGGEYIAFLDADDEWATPDLVPVLGSKVDVIRMGMKEIDQSGNVRILSGPSEQLNGIDYLNQRISSNTLVASPCVYLYRRAWMLEKSLRFYPGLMHEDMLFVVTSLSEAESVIGIEDIGYVYHRRPGSITSASTPIQHARRLMSLRRIHYKLILLQYSRKDLQLEEWLRKIRNYMAFVSRRSASRRAKFEMIRLYVQLFWTGYFLCLRGEWGFLNTSARRDIIDWIYCRRIAEPIEK